MATRAAQVYLIPIQELTPGAVGAIRNQVIENLVAQVSSELSLPPEKLIVRDVRPYEDLQMYTVGGTDATGERWGFTDAGTTVGFVNASGSKTMGNQRYVALFGVRDRSMFYGASGSATVSYLAATVAIGSSYGPNIRGNKQVISLIKIVVGGADKVTWDISCLRAYGDAQVAISPGAIIIPQNTQFQIQYYKTGSIEAGALTAPVASEVAWLQLLGVTVEPRGKTISP